MFELTANFSWIITLVSVSATFSMSFLAGFVIADFVDTVSFCRFFQTLVFVFTIAYIIVGTESHLVHFPEL